ncbi:hypothetical protein QYF36_012408 [Acer negundo]|nr:hypothetical protein QYF36_012408 [Acer negundo]
MCGLVMEFVGKELRAPCIGCDIELWFEVGNSIHFQALNVSNNSPADSEYHDNDHVNQPSRVSNNDYVFKDPKWE